MRRLRHRGRGLTSSLGGALQILSVMCLIAASAAAQSPSPGAPTTVRYAEIAREIQYLPVYVALEKGFFKEQGISVDLKTTWGPDRTTTALVTGGADIVMQGPDSAVYLANDPSLGNVKMFAALSRTDGMFLISRKKIPMEKFRWELLKGTTVLGRRTTTTPGLFFEFVLRNRGIDPARDINYRTNIPVPALAELWRSGTGEFGIFFETEVSEFERKGIGFPVASIGQEAGSVDFTVFMTTRDYMTRNPKVMQGWANAIQKALSWVATADPDAAARLVARFFPDESPEVNARAIRRYRKYRIWKTRPTISRKSIADLQSMMIDSRVIDPGKRVAYEAIVEPKFAERARKLTN